MDEYFKQIASQQGWTPETQVEVLLRFIDSDTPHIGISLKFRVFLEKQMEEENGHTQHS